MATRVLLCDDHREVRAGLGSVLRAESDLEVIGSLESEESLLETLIVERPDVVVLGTTTAALHGFAVLGEILKLSPRTRIVVLSMHDALVYPRSAFGARATGYLLKESAAEELAIAIRKVADGRRYLDPRLRGRLTPNEEAATAGILSRGARELRSELSAIRHDVLRLAALGQQTAEIATHLALPSFIVEAHERWLMKKLNVTTRIELGAHPLVVEIFGAGPQLGRL